MMDRSDVRLSRWEHKLLLKAPRWVRGSSKMLALKFAIGVNHVGNRGNQPNPS